MKATVIFIEKKTTFFFLKNRITKSKSKTKNKTKCHPPAPPILNIFFAKNPGINPWVRRINKLMQRAFQRKT